MIPFIEFVKKHTANDILNEKKKILSEELVDSYIENINMDNKLNIVYKCELSLVNINLALVNTLRRIVLSYIPLVALGKIKIEENNTSLINEFLEKRLNLLSVSMQTLEDYGEPYQIDKDEILKTLQLKSVYNKNLGIREYDFINHDKLPKFNLKKEQDSVTDYITSFNIININDKNFDYFNPNLFSNDYDIITKLKEKERINIIMNLDCGIGFINTIYSPVGTICVKPVCINTIENINLLLEQLVDLDDNELKKNLEKEKELYEEAIESYKNSIVKERLEKGLLKEEDIENPFDDEEINNIKHDFDTLIRPRIYPHTVNNNSTSFLINIESNCNLKAEQIFLDALTVLYINILDLKNNIKSGRPKSYNENECIKISITQNTSDNYELIIENENHTIGNLLINYLNLYNNQTHNDYKLDFISYTQPHPLINKILFKFITNLGQKTIFKILNEVLDKIHLDITILGKQYLGILKSQFNYEEIDDEIEIYPEYIPEYINYASFRIDFS